MKDMIGGVAMNFHGEASVKQAPYCKRELPGEPTGQDLPKNKTHSTECPNKGVNQILSALVSAQVPNHAPLWSCS